MTFYNTAAALVPILLLLFVAFRIPMWKENRDSRPLTKVLLALGLGQAARIPVISDDYFDVWLHDLTGIWNIPDATAVLLGTFAFCSIIEAVATVARPLTFNRRRHQWITALMVAIAGVGFLLSPATDTPTNFVSRDFVPTGPLLMYWGAYLGTLTFALAYALYYLVGLLRESRVRTGPLGRIVAVLTAACTLGFLYGMNKLLYLTLQAADVHNWYTAHAQSITLVLVLGPMIIAGYSLLVFATAILPDRIRRYNAIRQYSAEYERVLLSGTHLLLPRDAATYSTRRAAWSGSRTPIATHRMMVVLSDAATSR